MGVHRWRTRTLPSEGEGLEQPFVLSRLVCVYAVLGAFHKQIKRDGQWSLTL